MTLREVDASLPNGLHDSQIARLELDYVAKVARLHLRVWVGSLNAAPGQERERMRAAILELSGLLFCALEAPDARYPFAGPGPIKTTGLSSPASSFPLPAGAFEEELFISDWNSFIRLAAMSARLQWVD